MELDPSLGGQMQKQVTCNKELLAVCLPMLEGCDAQFSDWYRSKKGPDSIHQLVRLQSFITRYRVNPDRRDCYGTLTVFRYVRARRSMGARSVVGPALLLPLHFVFFSTVMTMLTAMQVDAPLSLPSNGR